MIRKIILSILLIGLTSTAFAQAVNYLELTNNSSDTNSFLLVRYNTVINQKVIRGYWLGVGQGFSTNTGVPPSPQPIPAYQVSSIFYGDQGTMKPLTSCPVLNFGQTYAGIIITINPDGSCSAVITPFVG